MNTTAYELTAPDLAICDFTVSDLAIPDPAAPVPAAPARPFGPWMRPRGAAEALDHQIRRAARRGDAVVLGTPERPLDLAADGWAPLLADRLAAHDAGRGLDLRLTVARLHPDRDPRLLARLDEEHAVTVDVVVHAADPADQDAVAATDAALSAAAMLAERGIVTRVVTPVTGDDADRDRLAAVARTARATGAGDWRAVAPAHRRGRRPPEAPWRREARRLRLELGLPRPSAARC